MKKLIFYIVRQMVPPTLGIFALYAALNFSSCLSVAVTLIVCGAI